MAQEIHFEVDDSAGFNLFWRGIKLTSPAMATAMPNLAPGLIFLIAWAIRILVPEYGFMPLELIPMLVGFFTYKIATFAQAIEEALTVVEKKTEA